MARIKPFKKEEAQGETREILESIEKGFGMVPNIFATMAKYPKVLKPIMDLYKALSIDSTIDPGLQELANLEVSKINRCDYCVSHHTEMAKAKGVSSDKIEALKINKLDKVFSDKEKAVIEYSSQVTRDAEDVSEDLFRRLKTYFSDSEIVNLTLIIGLMNVFNRFNEALGVELEK